MIVTDRSGSFFSIGIPTAALCITHQCSERLGTVRALTIDGIHLCVGWFVLEKRGHPTQYLMSAPSLWSEAMAATSPDRVVVELSFSDLCKALGHREVVAECARAHHTHVERPTGKLPTGETRSLDVSRDCAFARPIRGERRVPVPSDWHRRVPSRRQRNGCWMVKRPRFGRPSPDLSWVRVRSERAPGSITVGSIMIRAPAGAGQSIVRMPAPACAAVSAMRDALGVRRHICSGCGFGHWRIGARRSVNGPLSRPGCPRNAGQSKNKARGMPRKRLTGPNTNTHLTLALAPADYALRSGYDTVRFRFWSQSGGVGNCTFPPQVWLSCIRNLLSRTTQSQYRNKGSGRCPPDRKVSIGVRNTCHTGTQTDRHQGERSETTAGAFGAKT